MRMDCKQIWSECLALIREQLPPKKFKTWFEPIEALSFEQNVLTIQVPSVYVYECLEEHFIDVLREAMWTVIGPGAKLEYSVVVVKEENSQMTVLSDPPTSISPTRVANPGGIKQPGVRKELPIEVPTNLNPSYTLDSYIEGDCNRLARSAGVAIAQCPGGTAFNPLFIYGASGLGKTHLAQAIGAETKKNFPDKVVLYVSTHEFQTQFTNAVQKNEVNDFLHYYQLMDVLILDDIQELSDKKGTQKTFFHIFNQLQQSGKQLILTSDKSPAELDGMEERLLSRFRWGLSAEIKAPDFEMRLRIARYKAHKDGTNFSDEILECICKYVNGNVRELEGVMTALLAQSIFNRRDLTIEVVKDILGKIVKRQVVELSVERIQQVVCEHFKLSPKLLQEKTRKREIVQARQLAMYFCKNLTNASLVDIGNQIGKKDHTTVLYACKTIADLIEMDRGFRAQVEELQKKLYSPS